MTRSLLWAACGTGFTFLMTTIGAATVFLFREKSNDNFQKVFFGFAAGIMLAASVWSLILPAIEQVESDGGIVWIPTALGVLFGGAFIYYADRLFSKYTGSLEKVNMMVFAVTLHNIPEGMAVGLAFALAVEHSNEPEYFAAAAALAMGIGLQNFPEGAAVSLPLRQEGLSSKKSFYYGALSAVVEPVFGMAVVIVANWIRPLMPWFLSFAAGAMLYVVVDEIIPRANLNDDSHMGTLGAMAGFLIMMILDVVFAA